MDTNNPGPSLLKLPFAYWYLNDVMKASANLNWFQMSFTLHMMRKKKKTVNKRENETSKTRMRKSGWMLCDGHLINQGES